jgi:hypothetical protein
MAANIRKAADGRVPDHDSLKRMVWRWEKEGLTAERYGLLYARALGIDPGDLAGGPPGTSAGGGDREGGTAGRAWPGAACPVGADRPVSSDAVPQGRDDDVIGALVRAALAAGWARGDVLDVDDVERRELLKLLGGLGLAAPLAGGAEALRRELDRSLDAPTTGADVAEWERVAAQYRMESGVVAPAVLLPELLTDLDEAQRRLKGAPEPFGPPMARVCGVLSFWAGTNFYNAGDERSAGRYWRIALRFIDHGGDRRARSALYGYRAALTAEVSPSASLALADEAVRIADGVPCEGAAWGYQARAAALAVLGEHRESVRTLGDLTDTFTGLPESVPGDDYVGGYGERALRFTECGVFAYAGRASDAAVSQDAGRALVPDGYWLPYADLELRGAMCLVAGGDPSEGARHVVRTVEALPAAFRQSIVVRRAAAGVLDLVPAGAAGVPAVAEARELLALPSGAGA